MKPSKAINPMSDMDTGTLAEELSRLGSEKRTREHNPSLVWGTGSGNSDGNKAMNQLAMEVIENLQETVKKDQEALQYSFSGRIACLEKGIRDYRKLCAYHSEIRFNPGESKIRDFFMVMAHIVNIPDQLFKTLWQLHFELGL